jgi:polyhydroxyalkanoate synthase
MSPQPDLLGAASRELARVRLRARNGVRHLAGTQQGHISATARTAVWRRNTVVLYRYESASRSTGVPILLVMSLVARPHVFDLRPGSSLVEDLLRAGFDVFLIDWGVPGPADAHNGLDTYCDEYLPRAVDAVLRESGAGEIAVLGYCLGALLSLVSVAGNPTMPVRSLVLLAAPLDLRLLGPMGMLLAQERFTPEQLLDETGNVPPSVIHAGFRMVTPTAPLTTYANLWQSLVDEEQLAAHNALIGWTNDHIPFPGRLFTEIVDLCIRQGLLLAGQLPVGDRTVAIADLQCRVLNVIGDKDHLVTPEASARLPELIPNATLDHLVLPAGHAGLFVGRQARTRCVPSIVNWLLNDNEDDI